MPGTGKWADAAAGKLDFLVKEADAAIESGTLRDLAGQQAGVIPKATPPALRRIAGRHPTPGGQDVRNLVAGPESGVADPRSALEGSHTKDAKHAKDHDGIPSFVILVTFV
jgi:hypothetical protein